MIRVLVVDDDQPTREALRMILEDAGYAVVEAPGGDSALDLLRASTERLVVLVDQVMPQPDGLAVLAAIATDLHLAAHHAYALMTADIRPLEADEAALLATLSAPIIRKPFDIDRLLDIVAQSADRLS